jgi:MFS family permease
MRVANHPGAPLIPNRPFKLPRSFNLGIFGGMLGGFVAGTIVLLRFLESSQRRRFFTSDSDGLLAVILVIGGALSAAAVSASIQLGIARATQRRWPGNAAITGGMFGGAVGAIAPGAFLGWYFGYKGIAPIEPVVLMVAAIVTVIAITLSVLLHGRRAYLLQTLRGLAVSTAVAGFTAVPVFSILGYFVGSALSGDPTTWSGTLHHVTGGAVMGTVLGALMGVQIGTTFWVVRKWDEMAALEPRHHRPAAVLSRGVSAAFLWAIAAVCLFGGVTTIARGQPYPGLGFLAMAASLGTAGRLRVKLEHKDFKVEVGNAPAAEKEDAGEDAGHLAAAGAAASPPVRSGARSADRALGRTAEPGTLRRRLRRLGRTA